MRSTPRPASWRVPRTGSCSRARTCSSVRARRMPPHRSSRSPRRARPSSSAPPTSGTAVGEREQAAIGPFVGRDAELDTLLAALTQAGEGPGALAIVTGAPGSARPGCWASCARRRPARARSASSARRRARTIPTRPPARSCGARSSSTCTLPSAEVERRLRAVVRERAPELAPWLPLLGLVVGLGLEGTPETAALEESFVSERIATSVEELLDAHRPGRGADRRRRRPPPGRGVGRADRPHRGGHPGRGAGCSCSRTAGPATGSSRPRTPRH